jgi:Holliday junction DNA helicase RuvA
MIYSLRGTLRVKDVMCAVVECGGVGYYCGISMETYSHLPKIGEETFLYTHFTASESGVALYGFHTTEELNCYRLLTSVNGVGAKAAMATLSAASPVQIAIAVSSGDTSLFKKVKGVGPKLASRIVLELQDKIAKQSDELFKGDISEVSSNMQGGAFGEAISALTVLGFAHSEAVKALSGAEPTLNTSDMLKYALKRLNK